MKRRSVAEPPYAPDMGTLTAPPTRGELWRQAHRETLRLPSWDRQRRLVPRFEELLREHGHIDCKAHGR